MLKATFRTAVQAALLFGAVAVVSTVISSRAALPAEKTDLGAIVTPAPQPKPRAQNPLCKTPFSELSRAVPGWRVLTNEKALIYIATLALEKSPPFDSVAYLNSGPMIAVLALYQGCVMGRLLVAPRTHDRAIQRATGIIV